MLKRIRILLIGLNLIIIGISILLGLEYKKYEIKIEENTSIYNYVNNKKSKYEGILEIPKLNFERGISNDNDINKNITFINKSEMPNIPNSTTIIAGHSGNNSNSYFKNLYKLKIGDYAYLIYDNIKYEYKIYKIDTIDKTGKLKLKKDNIKKLILITCKDLDKQLIVYFKYIKHGNCK